MSDMEFEEIINICGERVSNGNETETNREVIRENAVANTTSVVYSIPHSGNQYALTSDFEYEGFSLIPIGDRGHPVEEYLAYWEMKRFSWDWDWESHTIMGIQLFTGEASKKEINGVLHYPICWDIEDGLYLEHPDVFKQILHWALDISDVNLTITKSGGFRVNAWAPFVRKRSEQLIARREWVNPATGKPDGITYAEILSERGMARINNQYWQVVGEIAKWPILTKEEFLVPLSWIEPLDTRIRKTQNNVPLEEELGADLPADLSWRQGTHVLISQKRYDCEYGHKSNPTVEYRKYTNGSIVRVCYACGGDPIVVRSGTQSFQRTEADGSNANRNRTQQKLYQRSETIELATLEENQTRIKDAVCRPERVILIRGGTGDGKSEAIIELALTGVKIFMGVSTQKIADELERRFKAKGLDVLRWRTPTHGLTKAVKKLPIEERIPNGALCAIGDIYTNYQQRGGNPHFKLCPKCPAFEICEEKGLLAQRKRLIEADVVIMCFPQLVTNPACENTAIRYLGQLQEPARDEAGNLIPKLDRKGEPIIDIFGDPVYEYEEINRVAVFDDANLTKMFPKFSLSRKQIEDWCERWEGEALGEFAEELRVALRKEDFIPMLRQVVSDVSDEKLIAEQMCALRYHATFIKQPTSEFKGRIHIAEIDKYIPVARDMSVYDKYTKMEEPILKPDFEHKQHLNIRDLNRAVSLRFFDLESNTSISKMPNLPSNKNWTPWHALKSLFDEYPYDHMVPITYQEGRLIWHIHPKLHENTERIIIMGASLDIQCAKDTFKSYADSMYFLETLSTEWVDGSRFFQISTGKYSRRSLLNRNPNTEEYVSFTPTGNKMFKLIRQEMKSNPDTCFGIITFDWIVKNYKQKWQKKIPQLVYFENFQSAEGTNPEIDVLFVVGTPELPEDAIINTAKYMFGGTQHAKTPLDTSRCDPSNFNDGCPYRDWRMQVAWKHEVRELVIQAIGRARLNLYPRTVVALSGIWLPDITDHKETELFALQDWEKAGSLDKLPHEVLRSAEIRVEDEQREEEIARRIDQGEAQRYIADELDTTTYQVGKVAAARRACNNLSTAGEKVATLREKILNYFQDVQRKVSTSEIIEEFQQQDHANSIKKEIGRLRESGLIIRVKHGWYQLLDPMEYDRCCDEILFLFHIEYACYTNLRVAEILGRPNDEVNKALSDLIDAGYFLTVRPDGCSSVWGNIPVLPRGKPFEIVNEDSQLLARGVVCPHTIFMLCDYELLEAAQGVEEFVDNCAEGMGLQPDIQVLYTSHEKFPTLPFCISMTEILSHRDALLVE